MLKYQQMNEIPVGVPDIDHTTDPKEDLGAQIRSLTSEGDHGEKPKIEIDSPAGRVLRVVSKRLEYGVPLDREFLRKRIDTLDDMFENLLVEPDAYGVAVIPLLDTMAALEERTGPQALLLEGLEKQIAKLAETLSQADEEKGTEIGIQIARLIEAQKRTFRGENILELPETEEEQRTLVRKMLDSFENREVDCLDFSVTYTVQALESAIPRMNDEVGREARARIALHDSSELIKKAGGWIKRPEYLPGLTIGSAATEAGRRGHAIKRDTITFLLQGEEAGGIKGLDVAKAWDLLQDANFEYFEIVREINLANLQKNAVLSPEQVSPERHEAAQEAVKEAQKTVDREDTKENRDALKEAKEELENPKLSPEQAEACLKTLEEHEAAQETVKEAQKTVEKENTKENRDALKEAKEESEKTEKLRNETWKMVRRTKEEDEEEKAEEKKGKKGDINKTANRIIKRLLLSRGKLILSEDERDAERVPANYETDPDTTRKEAVRNWILENLDRSLNGNNDAARKSLQLAEKLAIATLETSIWNRTAMAGNDQLGETIGLKGWRAGREKAGRARGPAIHEDLISGFGTSFLRYVLNTEENPSPPPDAPLYVKDIRAEGIEGGSYVYYNTVITGRFKALKDLLMDRQPKPFAYNKTFLQQAVVYFNTADGPSRKQKEAGEKSGDQNLRVRWVLGVVDIALADIDLGWSVYAFNEFRKAVTQEELSPSAGTFIPEKAWDWIADIIQVKKKLRQTEWQRRRFRIK